MLFLQVRIKPDDVQLIDLTHTDNDHTGNFPAQVKYTGAKVFAHKNEFEILAATF